MAHIANCHRDPERRPNAFEAADFNPCPPLDDDGEDKTEKAADLAPVSVLREIFVRDE